MVLYYTHVTVIQYKLWPVRSSLHTTSAYVYIDSQITAPAEQYLQVMYHSHNIIISKPQVDYKRTTCYAIIIITCSDIMLIGSVYVHTIIMAYIITVV